MTYYCVYDSPIGPLTLLTNGESLTGLWLPKNGRADSPDHNAVAGDSLAVICGAKEQLDEYFCGRRKDFDLPLGFAGDSFQEQVWEVLLTIPYGETTSYGAVARKLGDVALARAVGTANGANPIAIIVPCHRVIGSNGKLVGYGGGIETKKKLLDFEASVLLHGPQPFAEAATELSLAAPA